MQRNLVKTKTKKSKRLGRGYGSGKGGHTVGRGQKGQKSRNKVGILFEGIKVRKSLLKRTPQLRGKTKFSPKAKPVEIKLQDLNIFQTGATINIENLTKKGFLSKKQIKKGVKIIGTGKLKKKLNINVPITNSAKKQIEKLGGKVSENA